jgi:hypothetical protein
MIWTGRAFSLPGERHRAGRNAVHATKVKPALVPDKKTFHPNE